ncbi:hypothetical protein M407DRAFT_30419 [Tulasnella calospora MUT 4182]|uniref:Uncharacterized protein n=1 Tax=Tulasnella calospora MUT 4182 TaxID=1051891 RepID=A0A0C3LER3_9AGAM|nr:hypothetical protein M407DRAFT_30419 [Tulasnella calospora MUT 4182]
MTSYTSVANNENATAPKDSLTTSQPVARTAPDATSPNNAPSDPEKAAEQLPEGQADAKNKDPRPCGPCGEVFEAYVGPSS